MTRVVQLLGHAAGGIGVHVRDLTEGLRAAGEQVVVVAPADTMARFSFDTSGAADAAAWPRWSRPLAALRTLRRLRTHVRSADVVHAHGHQAGLAAVLAAIGLKVPVVISWHNEVLGSRGVGTRFAAAAERLQVRRAAMVTGASEDLASRARALGARAAEVAPVAAPEAGRYRGTRAQARAELAAELGLPSGGDGEVWALVVSRLAPQKNLPVLAEAARLLEDSSNLRWLLVGDGDADIRRDLLASTAGLPFHLLGARSDVPALMRAADLLVVPSRWEARALVVQEALAAGLPVVATEVGGLPELVAGVGLLVPVGDAPALAAAVAALAADEARRTELAGLAVARFHELPTSSDVVNEWRDRYRRVRPE